ncbi:glycosyltransferase family 4 protein [Allopusillimonas ginsengisoli]|uniref:glycosyltransferase family 4 protein n=1 Tax=Allopusillimonas ginsengisoli TaxID=453575 RepID=UPI0039C069CB
MPTPKFLIVTTVPETLITILKNQPKFLATALAERVAVELVTSPGAECSAIEQIEGLPVHPVHMVRGISPLKDLLSLLSMIRLLLRIKPSMVHSYTAKAGLITMLAAWICRVPVRIHTFTGLVFPTQTGMKQIILIWTDRLTCACASTIIPEGQGVKDDLMRFSITRKPLNLIGHGNIAGVDTVHFHRPAENVPEQSRDLARKLGLSGQEFIFCFVGRLNRDKGIAELLEAFGTLPEYTRLILIGALDLTAPICEQDQLIINQHKRIHALGFFTDIRPALHLANVLVLPSYREGFPNAVLQAGAMELPVIATDINGCNEVVKPSMNGWLVPPRSAGALHDAMRTALDTPPLMRRRMGVLARQRIVQRFEQKQHWRNMANFYTERLSSLQENTVQGGYSGREQEQKKLLNRL